MSDDDCDIFNLPTKQRNVVPKDLYVQEQNASQTDYDFIKTNNAVKQPAKATKTKRTAQNKSGKQPKQTDKENKEKIDKQELEGKAAAATAATSSAPSPEAESELIVSKLIHEMEQKKAKDIDALPVARRTRRSAGKQKQSEEVEVVAQLSPPKKQRGRGTRSRKQTQIANVAHQNGLSIGEIAARAKVIDTIDMVTAVVPPVEGFINLDSDEDGDELLARVKEPTPENNFDEDNQVLDINLNWLGEMQFYKLRQHQKFAHMFKEVAKRNNVPINDIVISMDDKFISQTESPANVGLKVYHFLSGCAMESTSNVTEHKEEENTLIKPKKFQLKVQGDKWKQPLIIQLKKTDAFKILYIKCAEEMDCNVRDFKLFFDGELLEPDDTPKNQDMEGNEMIDFRMK